MEQDQKHNLGLHISIYAISFALFVLTIGFIFLAIKHTENTAKANKQIDSLYKEIGDLNEGKTKFYTEFVKSEENYKNLYASIYNLSQGLDDNKKSEELQKILDNTKSQNESLKNLINDNLDKTNKIPLSDGILDFLILGTHSSLTDTIMIARIIESSSKLVLISIPRDTYYEGRKVNEIYYYHGIDKLKEAVSAMTGVVIEKYSVFDINSFNKFYETVFPNGVKVNVEKSIYDRAYPNGKGGYLVFSLNKGEQTLNGSTALKYIRTRHGDSDFDRAKRQQNFINAAVSEIKNQNLLDHLDLALKILGNIDDYVKTDIGTFEAMEYLKDYSGFSLATGNVLDNRNKEFTKENGEVFKGTLYKSTKSMKGQYIIIPTKSDYSDVWEYVKALSR